MRIQTSKNKTLILKIFCLIGLFASTVSAQKPATTQVTRTITVITEPNAIVWLDDLRRGTTDESGKLIIKPVTAGAHKLRVRADGFKETSQNLTAVQEGDV
ncbi:MAG: carboxypeptidase-like regulatory domain-containing protein, partial [Acidobacteriota bacterium]|nr:carboxypeptidase-like regulatory domain-containing protein [Acidobacteriota bacterium]